MKILSFILVFALSLTSSLSFAHREHGAHVHGAAKLAVAFDDTKGKVEFKGAAEGILGFEHSAKTAADKKTLSDAIDQFTTDIAKMVAMNASLNCQFTKEKVDMVKDEDHDEDHDKGKHGEHSDFVANFTVACTKSPVGTSMTIDFSKFTRLHDLDITVLAGALQKTTEAKGKPVTIDLK